MCHSSNGVKGLNAARGWGVQITPGGARAAIEEIIAGSNSLLEGLSFGGMTPYLEVEALWIELRNRKREQQHKGTLFAPGLCSCFVSPLF